MSIHPEITFQALNAFFLSVETKGAKTLSSKKKLYVWSLIPEFS